MDRPDRQSEQRFGDDDPHSQLATRNSQLVVAYGNPLRADDGVGWHVARELADDQGNDTDVISTHQLTPELAEPISRARRVVFVDARADGEPGILDYREVARADDTLAADALADSALSGFSHAADPTALLELARLVYGTSPPAAVVSIGGVDFGYGTGLSPVVQAAVPELVRLVRWLLAEGTVGRDWPGTGGSIQRAHGGASCTS